MKQISPLPARMGSNACSGRLGKIILQGMSEIIGQEDTRRILNQGEMKTLVHLQDCGGFEESIPYRQISRLQQTMECLFGERGGQGLSYRMGQSTFRCGMRELGWSLELSRPEYRLLSPFKKITEGARYLAGYIDANSSQHILVETSKDNIHWIVQRCPVCWGRRSDNSICHHTAGFLHEFVTWMSGGKVFSVIESECSAAGGINCMFTITKLAAD